MKKIFILVIFLGILASIDHTQLFSWFHDTDEEVIAEVNGEQIRFEDIEALYDIKNAHKTIQPPRVSQLHRDYASLLYTRIEQILVAQELVNRGLEVSQKRLDAFEKLISQDHNDVQSLVSKTFEELVEESGIQYSIWKEQILTRLQTETLQQDIIKNIVLEPNEIIQYVQLHPELANISETFEFILLESEKKDDLYALKKSTIYDHDFIKEKNIKTFSGFFSAENIPELYQKPLENLTNNTFSELITLDNKYEMLYLICHTKTVTPSTLELYALAEEALLMQKAEKTYDEWLMQALKNADIKIESEFLPSNLPKKLYSLEDALEPQEGAVNSNQENYHTE